MRLWEVHVGKLLLFDCTACHSRSSRALLLAWLVSWHGWCQAMMQHTWQDDGYY